MDNRLGDNDPPQTTFLLSEPKAILEGIISRDEDSNSEDLPSTVDMDALKEPLLSVNDDPLHMGQWRSTVAPRIKAKTYEAPKKDQQVPNGLETESHSEESHDSDGSSSDSDDSDSGSGSGSGSSTNSGSSGNSSGSSDSSDSDSDSHSNRSSSSQSMPQGPKTGLARTALPSRHTKDTHSRSNSSTSSRSRRNKHFSISQSTYEPGSLKLKIAALKIPHRQQPQDQRQASGFLKSETIKSPPNLKSSSLTNGSTSDLSLSNPVVNGSDEKFTTPKREGEAPSKKESDSNPSSELRRSARYNRGKQITQSTTVDNPVLNGICSTPPPPPSSRPLSSLSKTRKLKTDGTTSVVDLTPQSASKDSPCPQPSHSNSKLASLPGLVSTLNENVTMTLNNGFNISKRADVAPSSPFSGLPSSYLSNNINGIDRNETILDPVLRLTKNSDLTIFPIHPKNIPLVSKPTSLTWNTQDTVLITPTGTPTPTSSSTSIQPSPLRSSRRISNQRRSMDTKSDEFESWDSADASAAVQAAIQRIDSEVNSEDTKKCQPNTSNNNSPVVLTPCSTSSSSTTSSNKNYNSSLLEKFTEMLTSPQGNTSPQVGEISIEPIVPNSNHKSSVAVVSQILPEAVKDASSKKQKDKQYEKESGRNVSKNEKVRIVPDATPVKVSRNAESLQQISGKKKSDKLSPKSEQRETEKKNQKNGNIVIVRGRHDSKESSKSKKIKPNKLSIFASHGKVKHLRSNGRILGIPPHIVRNVGLNRKAEQRVNLSLATAAVTAINLPKRTHSDTKISVPDKVKSKGGSELEKDLPIEGKKSVKPVRDRERKGRSRSGSGRKDKEKVQFLMVSNGPVKAGSGTGSGTATTGENVSPSQPIAALGIPTLKTKGAKKYIPESEHLVNEQQQPHHTAPEKETLTSHTSSGGGRKKSKKSRAKDKKDKKEKKVKSEDLESLDVTNLCESIRQCALKNFPSSSKSKTLNTSTNSSTNINKEVKEPLIFKRMVFKNLFTPLIPNDLIPPPPYAHLVSQTQTPAKVAMRESPQTQSTVNSSSGIGGSNSTRKRKISAIISSQEALDTLDINDQSASSSELQRLPLKKRHHHASTGGINEVIYENCVKSYGDEYSVTFKEICEERTILHTFGSFQLRQLKAFPPTLKVNDSFGRVGRGEKLKGFAHVDFNFNKEKAAKVVLESPEKRRSGRIRKPRQMDGDIIESPAKVGTPAISPNSSVKIKKETPVKSEAVVVKSIPTPVNATSSIEASAIPRSSRKRGRSSTAAIVTEDKPLKKIKTEVIDGPALPSDEPPTVAALSPDITSPIRVKYENSSTETPTTSSGVALPQISPSSQVKKRRKVNRTGFPVLKKKKKVSLTPGKGNIINNSAPTSSGVESGSESVVTVSEGVAPENETEPAVFTKGRKSSSRKTLTEQEFTLSLTERVKIRKRNSVDGTNSMDEGNVPDIPGVCPALINTPDPPIIMPEKTNWLVAGLLSNYYKRNDPVAETSNTKKQRKGKCTDGLLPPPAYSPQFVRQRQVDYQLPYDVWCFGVIRAKHLYEQWQEEQKVKAAAAALAAAAQKKIENRRKSDSVSTSGISKPKKVPMPEIIPPSWNFKRIRSNTYYGLSKPPTTIELDGSCSCPENEQKCSGDDCLNRLVFTECPPNCGDSCTNRRIQKHDWAPGIKRFLTPDKGFGVLTNDLIKKGEFILEYVGEVVADGLFKERMHTIYANDTHHYCLQLDGGLVIDGHRAGGEGRFVNHSCEPNCEMQKWSVNGLSRMALFALRDINEGEELSYDYNFSLFNPAEGQPCHCGSSKCRGVIGGRTKNLKNDGSGTSKRKTPGKGAHGIKDSVSGGHQDPAVLDKMKALSRKERNFIQSHHVFLVRSYYKIRHMRGEVEDKIGDRLEKIMQGWLSRYKAGSSKNKPLQLPEDDPQLARMARMAQIFHELLARLITARDPAGNNMCGPFMLMPARRKSSQFYALFEKGQEPLDLTIVGKKILRGEYRTLQALEADIGTVLSSFCQAYEKEKPQLSNIVDKIKKLYMELKGKAMTDLEPFVVLKGNINFPKFIKIDQGVKDDVIRCVCGTFSEEGLMIQCEGCLVWQHADCMQVPQTSNDVHNNKGRRKGKGKGTARNYPLSPLTSPFTSPATKPPGPKNCANTPLMQRRMSCDGKGEVELEDLLISVKEEIPVEIKEDTTPSDQDKEDPLKVGKLDIKEDCVTTKESIPPRSINEMDTQLIDADSDVGEEIAVKPVPPYKIDIEGLTIVPKQEVTLSVEQEIMEILDPKSQDELTKNEAYFCEKCNPRVVDREVPLDSEHDTPEKKHYMTLEREDGLMLHKNDTVYVLRDSPPDKKASMNCKEMQRLTYITAGPLVPSECDIFRVEALWKDAKGGRYVFGYHYLRPNETFHEPIRRFYPNEILRAPLFEVISIDLIHGRCWVVDPVTYCKGRPIGCVDEHLYICEYRVDKAARSFSKVGKSSQSICTKPFAFQLFETRLKIQRNIHPHGPPSPDFRMRPVSSQVSTISEKAKAKKADEKSKYKSTPSTLERLKLAKKRSEQKDRVNRLLSQLHARVPNFLNGNEASDASTLLQIGRKKPPKKFSIN